MQKLQLNEDTHSFLEHLFYDLDDDEYIRTITFNSKGIPHTKHHMTVNDLMEDQNKGNVYFGNRYFQIQSTDGVDGTKKHRKYAYCLAFDIDLCDNSQYTKEELHQMKLSNNNDTFYSEMNDLRDRIFKATKDINFYIHYMISSGFGFQIYQLIQKTDDFEKVMAVQSKIYDLLMERSIVVDSKALSPTQILRIPQSYNNKINRNKPIVKIVANNVNSTKNDKSADFRRLSINTIYNTFVEGKRPHTADISDIDTNSTSKALIKKSDGKNKYLEYVMINGSKEGVRHKDFVNIIVYLKYKKVSYDKICDVIREWSKLSNYESEISDTKIRNYYNNYLHYIELTDEEVKQYYGISHSFSDFNYTDDDKNLYGIIDFNKKVANRTKGGLKMDGKAIFIYNVLAHKKGTPLTIENIIELITDEEDQPIIKKRTVSETLKTLIDFGVVEKIGKTYTVKENRKTKFIKMSYFVNLAVIWHKITLEELRFYTYLRIRQSQLVEEGKAFGCELSGISMETMADEFGIKDRHTIGDYLKKFTKLHIIDRIKIQLDNVTFTYKYFLNK